MKISKQDLESANIIAKREPSVKAILEFYEYIVSGNKLNYESYIARVKQLSTWNDELIEAPVSILGNFKSTSLDDEGLKTKEEKLDKETDRVLKFLKDQESLLNGVDAIRTKLLPGELEQLQKDKRLNGSPDLAF